MRSLWSGSLSFGLVNIPVKLYSASEERALSFKLFDKHGNCPISYVKVCRANHKEVSKEDIVKGYEFRKGDYVILDEADFKKASPKKTELIEIVMFTDEASINTKYYEKPYYVESEKRAAKAYTLLREALAQSKKVGIARFVMRNKEYIGVLKAEDSMMILMQMRYQDEIRPTEGLVAPKEGNYAAEELDVALALIKHLTKKFDPKKFKDTYTEDLREIIAAKARGKKIAHISKEKVPADTQMKDLMKVLRKSLEQETAHA